MSRNLDVSKNNLVAMPPFAFSKIQQSGYWLLEVWFLVEESIEENDRKRARFQGGIISLGRKKSRGSNSGDGGNTGDESKMGNEVIGACGRGIGYSLLVALYTCMTFIYRSSWKGEMVSEAERSLDKSSEGSEEVFPGEAGE
ncbi:hypothetical protein Tco_1086322 [Tanacetum coccineum]